MCPCCQQARLLLLLELCLDLVQRALGRQLGGLQTFEAAQRLPGQRHGWLQASRRGAPGNAGMRGQHVFSLAPRKQLAAEPAKAGTEIARGPTGPVANVAAAAIDPAMAAALFNMQ